MFTDDQELTKDHLFSQIENFKKMKLLDQKAGRTSAARRKVKNIKLCEQLLEKINKGEKMNMKELPLLTPPKNTEVTGLGYHTAVSYKTQYRYSITLTLQ